MGGMLWGAPSGTPVGRGTRRGGEWRALLVRGAGRALGEGAEPGRARGSIRDSSGPPPWSHRLCFSQGVLSALVFSRALGGWAGTASITWLGKLRHREALSWLLVMGQNVQTGLGGELLPARASSAGNRPPPADPPS